MTILLGTSDNPFDGSVDIIMTGNGPVDISLPQNFPSMESKMITVLGGLDLHGLSHTKTWTRLAQTASSSTELIILSTPVDWQTNDEIIITTTDTAISHTERHRIARIINGTIIRTVNPLTYTHSVIQYTFVNGQKVNIAAAVGLLTRNVRIINQNPTSSLSGFKILITEYRTNIYYSDWGFARLTYYKGYARLSNVQFIGFGQFDDTSSSDQRAGIYMSQLGDWYWARQTYIDSCSFDNGFNGA